MNTPARPPAIRRHKDDQSFNRPITLGVAIGSRTRRVPSGLTSITAVSRPMLVLR